MENLKNITPVEDFNWDAYENGKPLQNEKGEPIVSGDSMDELEYAGNINWIILLSDFLL